MALVTGTPSLGGEKRIDTTKLYGTDNINEINFHMIKGHLWILVTGDDDPDMPEGRRVTLWFEDVEGCRDRARRLMADDPGDPDYAIIHLINQMKQNLTVIKRAMFGPRKRRRDPVYSPE
jgi:hypothetical protein